MNERNYPKPMFHNKLREIEKERQKFFIDYFEKLNPDQLYYLRELSSK